MLDCRDGRNCVGHVTLRRASGRNDRLHGHGERGGFSLARVLTGAPRRSSPRTRRRCCEPTRTGTLTRRTVCACRTAPMQWRSTSPARWHEKPEHSCTERFGLLGSAAESSIRGSGPSMPWPRAVHDAACRIPHWNLVMDGLRPDLLAGPMSGSPDSTGGIHSSPPRGLPRAIAGLCHLGAAESTSLTHRSTRGFRWLRYWASTRPDMRVRNGPGLTAANLHSSSWDLFGNCRSAAVKRHRGRARIAARPVSGR